MCLEIGTKTSDDAFQRVLLARMGSMGPDATDDYLLQLKRRLYEFIGEIDAELARRIEQSKNDVGEECAECSGIGDACTCDEAFAQMYEGRA